jgi:hypothetical protein
MVSADVFASIVLMPQNAPDRSDYVTNDIRQAVAILYGQA